MKFIFSQDEGELLKGQYIWKQTGLNIKVHCQPVHTAGKCVSLICRTKEDTL